LEIIFILVEPAVPGNIGAAARAIKTMGFAKLFLVNSYQHEQKEAEWMAHGSKDILDQISVFPSLKMALEKVDFALATTAKARSVAEDILSSQNLVPFFTAKGSAIQKLGIVFGREESGLTNEEIDLCDLTSSITLKTQYPSLNLAQAVMIYAYELSKLQTKLTPTATGTITNNSSWASLKIKVENILLNAGFKNGSNIWGRIFERMAQLDETDINLMHSVCNRLLEQKQP
jgi:tRNA/rRNA methyltransferase